MLFSSLCRMADLRIVQKSQIAVTRTSRVEIAHMPPEPRRKRWRLFRTGVAPVVDFAALRSSSLRREDRADSADAVRLLTSAVIAARGRHRIQALKAVEEERGRMAKRMILMLTVTVAIIAALGFVKFKQIQTAMAEGAAFQPPPEAVTTIVAQRRSGRRRSSAIGTVAAVQGVTVSADLPGIVERIAFESGQAVQRRRRAGAARHAAGAGAAGGGRGAARPRAPQLRAMKGLLEQRVISQAEFDRATTEQKQLGGAASARSAPRSSARRSARRSRASSASARSTSASTWPAGDPVVLAAVAQPDLRELRRAAAGCRRRCASAARCASRRTTSAGLEFDRPRHRDRLGRRRGDAQRAGAGDARQPRRQAAARACSCRREVVARREPHGHRAARVRRSATRRTAIRSSSSTDLKGPNGKTYRGVRQQFVKLGGARGDQVAVARPASSPGDEVVTSGVFKLRNGAAVQSTTRSSPPTSRRRSPRTADADSPISSSSGRSSRSSSTWSS